MTASREIQIFTDSTSDLTRDMAKENGISIIPLSVVIGDEGFLDRETIDLNRIIEVLKEGEFSPKTGTPGIGIIEQRFRRAGDGVHIVSVNLGNKLSGVYAHALVAADHIDPHPKIIDSETTSMALGFLAIEAARLAHDGKTSEEIVAAIETMKKRCVAMVALPTTIYAERGGRISHLQGVVGSMLHICPILEVRDGRVESLERPRTWHTAKNRLIEIAHSMEFEKLAVMYVESDTEARELMRSMPVPRSGEILMEQLCTTLATHVGPGGLAVCGIKALP